MFHQRPGRRRPPILLLVPLLLLAACVEVEDHLTINADGSGSVTLTVTPHITVRNLGVRHQFSHYAGNDHATLIYPPLSRQDCQALFPGEGFTITTGDTPRVGQPFTATITFASIDQLLASPYATARQLSIDHDNDGLLTVRGIGGLAPLARLAMLPQPDPDTQHHGMPQFNHEQFLARLPQARGIWRLTLPNPASSADGAVDDHTVTWTIPYQEDHAAWRQALAGEQVASCRVEDMSLPASPLRLGRRPFHTLSAGAVAPAQEVDEAAIIAAATTTPQQLAITRSFAYIIERHQRLENHARLHASFSLPQSLAPMHWGETSLTRAEDDQGRSLLPPGGDDRHRHRHHFGSSFSSAHHGPSDGMARHQGHFDLAVPARDSQRLALIEGSISLRYPGAIELIPIPEAASATAMEQDDDTISLEWNVDALNALGAQLQNLELHRQPWGHSLHMHLANDQLQLMAIQGYDGDGLPLPTLLQSRHGSWQQIAILGIGSGPLHIALALAKTGATVDLPFTASDLPLTTPTEAQP